jgi:hypothetical protein
MKKFLALFVATLMLLVSITGCKSKETSASASSGAAKTGDTSATQANIDTNKASDDDCFEWNGTLINKLTDKGKKQESLVIPQKATGIADYSLAAANAKTIAFQNPSTEMGMEAMSYCKTLTTVALPKNLTSINNSVFSNDSALKTVEIPETVTSIGSSAFIGCEALESITIPKSVKEIGDYAFGGCTSLKSITIPDSVTVIEKNTFFKCAALTTVDLPKTLTSIQDSAFGECTALSTFTIPDKLTEIGAKAFMDCSSIKSVTIPQGVSKIGLNAFYTNAATSIKVKKGSYADAKFKKITDSDIHTADQKGVYTKEYY